MSAAAIINCKRVLIVRLGAFGDIIHTLPLAADLQRCGMRVDWLCDQPWQIVLEDNPVIDRCYTIPRRAWKRAGAFVDGSIVNYISQLRQQLHARDYDVAIDAQGRAKSALLARLSGARRRISHQPPIAGEGSWLLAHCRVPTPATHIVDIMRSLSLPLLGAAHPGGGWLFPLPAWESERAWARDWLQAHNLSDCWIWNVGATWPTKLWPLQRQHELLQILCDAGHQVLVTWGPGWEAEHAHQLCAREPRAQLAPATTLPQLAGLMAAAQIVLSCDTGPLHLAMALQVPAVGLFGPVPAERNGPRGSAYRMIQAPGRAWERRDVSKVHMDAISAAQVYREAQLALAAGGP